jgi:A/G-specific adenine glycosylase
MLPVKKKGINRRERFFNYFIVEYGDTFYVQKRNGKDIWQGLYEFILIETPNLLADIRLQGTDEFSSLFSTNDFIITGISKIYSQKLTHQIITGKFFHVHLKNPLKITDKLSRVSKKQLAMLPFPKFITSYLKD